MANIKTVGPPIHTAVSVAASGDNTVVAAVSGKQILVTAYTLLAAGAVDIQWWSAAAGTALSGLMSLDQFGGMAPAFGDALFETAAGEALILNLSAAIQVSGHITYHEVTPAAA